MKPTYHLIVSIILCAVLYPFYGVYSLLAFAGGFLIDIDHYIFYVVKKKDLSIKRMYDYCIDSTYNHIFCIFHNVEFVFVILVLSMLIPKFFIFSIGVFVHLTMDLIAVYLKGSLKKEIRAFSLIARMNK